MNFKHILDTNMPIKVDLYHIDIETPENLFTAIFLRKLEAAEINDFVIIPVNIFPFIVEKFKETRYKLQIVEKNDFVVICTKEIN